MAPIKLGIIGLSTASKATNFAAVAHLPYLQSKQGKANYEIVALCNSSVDSAKKSVKHFELPDTVKTYGSPEDLAADPDVELVVCVVGVETHYEVLLPVVKAGKNIYTELPLASNMEQIKELQDLAEMKGVMTMFGSQGQASPVVHLVKKLIADGKIGKALSTTLIASTGFPLDKPLPPAFRMLGDRKAGGNVATIWFLHSITCVFEVFGELEAYSSIMGIDHPYLDIMDLSQGDKIIESVKKDCPDNILLQGRLDSGTLLTYQMRTGESFPGEPGCRWIINGEKGDIQITSPSGIFDVEYSGVEIKFREAGSNKAQTIGLPKDELSDLKDPARGVGRLYEAYAKSDTGSYGDWNVALKRHKFIDEMFRRSDIGKPYGEPSAYRSK